MSEPDTDYERRAVKAGAWKSWAMRFFPFMALILIANVWIEFNLIVGALIVLLGATLLYQRYVNRRNWASIMWGTYAKSD